MQDLSRRVPISAQKTTAKILSKVGDCEILQAFHADFILEPHDVLLSMLSFVKVSSGVGAEQPREPLVFGEDFHYNLRGFAAMIVQ